MSIATQIERIQNEVNTQEDLIAQIAAALEGKAAGGSSGSYELGTFTIEGFTHGLDGNNYRTVVCPLLVGMTWQEWINSPLNVEVLSGAIGFIKLLSYNGYIQYINQTGLRVEVSRDGTASGRVLVSDIIQNGTQYLGYIDNSAWQ